MCICWANRRRETLIPVFNRSLYFSKVEGKEPTNKTTVRLFLLMVVPV